MRANLVLAKRFVRRPHATGLALEAGMWWATKPNNVVTAANDDRAQGYQGRSSSSRESSRSRDGCVIVAAS